MLKKKMEKNKRMVERLKNTLAKIHKLPEIQLDDDEKISAISNQFKFKY